MGDRRFLEELRAALALRLSADKGGRVRSFPLKDVALLLQEVERVTNASPRPNGF